VIAHPGRYRLSCAEMDILFEQFRDLGGDAVEVACGAHDGGQVLAFARMARKFGLMASGRPISMAEDSPIDLGRAPPLPPDLTPVVASDLKSRFFTMAQFFTLHPEQPQPRLIKQAAEIMRGGGLVAFPPIRPTPSAATPATTRCWRASGASAGSMSGITSR
jgi:hypothetical protein